MKHHAFSCTGNHRFLITGPSVLFICLLAALPLWAHDLSTEKVLYTVGTAHLDTQWRWTIQDTINDYLEPTLLENFSRFENYPDYVFSFEGTFRYMLIKEYFPNHYATLTDYINQGRWRVAGSTIENGDMNVVSPEAMIRQALLGNNFFEDEFGKRSTDIFLPDCFGFSYTMPTWISHCGLIGFSTQKLSWGSSIPIPFDIGVWKGPDGSSIIAALKPGPYSSDITSDLSNDPTWISRINDLGDNYGVYAGYKYFGTGDTGGAPSASSCNWLQQAIDSPSGPLMVDSAGSDELYNDVTAPQKLNLPVHDGELLMRIHGTGCYTSETALKRWNRQNELLADSSERVAALADWMGLVGYPQETFDKAWVRFLWHSHHDDLPGTSIPAAYHFSWNDYILSLNQFASILNTSVGSVAQTLDTQTVGTPVIVYNPLAFSRNDVVEATVTYATAVPNYVQVFDDGTEVPSQIVARDGNQLTVAFLAQVPSVGLKVFDVLSTPGPSTLNSGLSVTSNTLENDFYTVTIDGNGDVASIYDKQNARELLSAPCRLELLSDYSPNWPAWEVRYEDVQQAPYAYISGPAEVAIVQNGPARVALRISRTYAGDQTSTFVQEISLQAGPEGRQINVNTKVDWRTTGTMLKAAFPLVASDPMATYDLGMGTIQRPNDTYNLYEVPAQQWADLTHQDQSFGVAILNNCRYGWDKPADNTLRLTLIHTPNVSGSWTDQRTQDIGQHELTYAFAPHTGDWIAGEIPQRAARLNQPLIAFQADKHAGDLGSSYSFLQVDNPQVFVKAIKKAQRSDELIVRVQELYGSSTSNVHISVGEGVASAREINGSEQPVGPATLNNSELEFSLNKYQPRTFALTLAPSTATGASITSQTVALPYNLDAFSFDANRSDGDFDNGMTYPAELMSDTLEVDGIPFQMGSRADGQNNALACMGQALDLTGASYDSLYLLAASRGGDTEGDFTVVGETTTLAIQDYHENIVDWGREGRVPYLKHDTVGYIGTHRHEPAGNMAYEFCNLFLYRIDLPADPNAVALPDNDDIVIFAMTLTNRPADNVQPASAMLDTLPYLPELAPKAETRTNLALNKPVSADMFVNGENPELAVDGTVLNNSKWTAVTGQKEPHWLVVDLQQEYDVDTFVVQHAGSGGETSDWNTRAYCIQRSDNGVDGWEDIVCVTDNSQSITRHVITPIPARYLRLYITDPTQNTDTASRIYEFEVYGPCDGDWLEGDIAGPGGMLDCRIDLNDFRRLAQGWSQCNDPTDASCSDYWQAFYDDLEPVAPPTDPNVVTLPESSLLAWWKMEEGSGATVADLAGVADDGTLQGNTLPQWTTGWFPQHGSANYALYFDTTGYITINPVDSGPNPNLHNVQNAISISAWCNADDWNGNRRILQKGNSDNQYRLLAENGKMVFDISGVGRIEADLPTAGQWHHIAGVFDGSAMRLFIDGLEKAMLFVNGAINLTSDPIYVGTKTPQAPSGDHFKGYLDDIRIYSVGLSAAEVRELARQGQNLPPTILSLQRQADTLVSLLLASPLEVTAWDVNGDALNYAWSETGGSPEVSFSPNAQAEDPEVQFAQAGDYTVELAVSDGQAPAATATTDFHLTALDCATIVNNASYQLPGDVNRDCHVDMLDLMLQVANWLACSGSECV